MIMVAYKTLAFYLPPYPQTGLQLPLLNKLNIWHGMWRKFQAFIQSTRSVLVITPSVALTVIIGQSLGVFNLP